MDKILTSTRHTLNFNSLSYDKFEDLCFWLVDDLGEYQQVEHYGGVGDRNRDIIGYTSDDELDYFQCKRQEDLNYNVLKKEIDGLLAHIATHKIKKPRRLYFVLSSEVSPDAKDKAKKYAADNGLSEPSFWEPIILHKKLMKNPDALENFFGIANQTKQEHLPQVCTTGLINYGTQETTFTVANHGDTPAIDCSWSLIGFGWPGYYGGPTVFDLKPGQEINLRIAMSGQFMGQKPIKELRLRFKFRDNKNNWYYSERYLIPELVPSGSFYRIRAEAGFYIPAEPIENLFSIDNIEQLVPTGLNKTRLVSYNCDGISRSLKINISTTLAAIWQFTDNEMESAFRELAEKKISQMIKNKKFEEEFHVDSNIKPTQMTGFEAYRELRNSL